MTDCGQKCFELQDTEYSFAVEKENNQKLEAEVKRLKGIIETPCTSCCITEDLEHSLDDLNYQNISQDGEIRQLKVQIENLEKDKEQIIFESDLKIKALEDHIEEMKTAIINFSTANSLNEKYNSYQKLLELAE